MDTCAAVIIGLTLVPIVGTLAGWYREALWWRELRAACPACGHPEHWPWCRQCGCDLFTEPVDETEGTDKVAADIKALLARNRRKERHGG